VLLQRNENTVMANNAATNSMEVKTMRNSKTFCSSKSPNNMNNSHNQLFTI